MRSTLSRIVLLAAAAAAAVVAAAASAAAADAPKTDSKRSVTFQTYCITCHGEDGKAQTPEGKRKKARDLSNAKWQATVSDERLASSIKRGREEMPAFGRKLGDAEIKALIPEIRALATPAP
jgi:mono/diheme cytochrome c family protein